MVDCSATDVLGTVSDVHALHRWYSRLADLSARQVVSGGGVPLSAELLRRYLSPSSTPVPYVLQVPDYLRNQTIMRDALEHHRRVYLGEEPTRFGSWGGVRPRFLRVPVQHRRNQFGYTIYYESLVEPPWGWSVWGTDDQKDLITGLGTGWQLRTEVSVVVTQAPRSRNVFDVRFLSVLASIWDFYDFDRTKHLSMPNPDFGLLRRDAICPRTQRIVVYHRNAHRLIRAGLAEEFELRSPPWIVRWPDGRTSAERPGRSLPW